MGRECYHCHEWVEDKQQHDCWTTTEKALTSDLTEDLMDAWERLRETAGDFGGTAHLRITQLDHVFPKGLLLLCSAEEEISGDLVFSRTERYSTHRAQDSTVFQTECGPHGARHSPRPG
jgi:hypothetical protein